MRDAISPAAPPLEREWLQSFIRTYGASNQLHQAVEECAEFIVAVNKVRRSDGSAESLQALAGEAAEPEVRGVADGLAGRVDGSVLAAARTHRLRMLGNGVVPATAQLAFETLYERLRERSGRVEKARKAHPETRADSAS